MTHLIDHVMLAANFIERSPSNGFSGPKWRKPGPVNHALLFALILCLIFIGSSRGQGLQSNRTEAIRLIQEGDNMMSFANWQEALFAYDNAIAIDPSYSTAFMKKANLLAKIGRNQEALKLYDRAIQLNPYSEYIYDSRAKLKMLAMDYSGALDDLNNAMAIDPSNEKIRDRKVDDLIAMKAYEQALVELDTLIMADYKVVYELERKALVLMLIDSVAECRKHWTRFSK